MKRLICSVLLIVSMLFTACCCEGSDLYDVVLNPAHPHLFDDARKINTYLDSCPYGVAADGPGIDNVLEFNDDTFLSLQTDNNENLCAVYLFPYNFNYEPEAYEILDAAKEYLPEKVDEYYNTPVLKHYTYKDEDGYEGNLYLIQYELNKSIIKDEDKKLYSDYISINLGESEGLFLLAIETEDLLSLYKKDSTVKEAEWDLEEE